MMTWLFLIRILVCLFVACVLTEGHKNTCRKRAADKKENDYRFGIFQHSPMWIFGAMILVLVVSLCSGDTPDTFLWFLTRLLSVFLEIMLIFSVLALTMPLLRRRILASTCSNLWVIPCGLFAVSILFYGSLNSDPSPAWLTIVLPGAILLQGIILWLSVFAALLGWAVISHLLYRKHLLKNAYPVNETTRAQWLYIRQSMGCKTEYPLVISPAAVTPVSVGVFRSTIQVVLPEKDYGHDDLHLILRHELVHILRDDGQLKLLLAFSRSLFWFNPLVWLAMKMSAEDTELACDELVLDDAPEEIRERYARLVLGSAGDARGFSSCLSPRASSLRYRLREIMSSDRRSPGYVYIGALLFAIFLLFGRIDFVSTPVEPVSIFGEELSELPTADELRSISYEHITDTEETIISYDHAQLNRGLIGADALEELCSYLYSDLLHHFPKCRCISGSIYVCDLPRQYYTVFTDSS